MQSGANGKHRECIVFRVKCMLLFTACFMLCGFQNNDQKNVVHPDNSKNQQQWSKSNPPAQSAIAPQSTDKNASDSRGQNKDAQSQKVSLVSVPEGGIEQRKDKFDWVMLGCTVLLTIVGIVGTCLALRTLKAIQAQVRAALAELKHTSRLARAAQKTAEAANKNADAIINSERAWVMVEVVWASSEGGRLLNTSHIGDAGQVSSTQIYVNLICVNRGKSPAWVVEQTIKAEISGAFYGPDLSTVNDSEIDRRLISLGPSGTTEDRTARPIKLYAPGMPGNKYILVYGVVRYRDPFTPKGELKETWFGYYTLETRIKDPLDRISQTDYNKYA